MGDQQAVGRAGQVARRPRALAAALLLAVGLPVGAQPSQVIVVRHAERAAEPKADPSLSTEGEARAQALADILASAQVNTIITTQLRRTQETAAPVARQTGVVATVVPIASGGLAAHVADVVAQVRRATGVVLVVGHSNTVGPIVAGLSASTPVALCETSYSHLFVATPGMPTAPALQLRYGKADPSPGQGCQ